MISSLLQHISQTRDGHTRQQDNSKGKIRHAIQLGYEELDTDTIKSDNLSFPIIPKEFITKEQFKNQKLPYNIQFVEITRKSYIATKKIYIYSVVRMQEIRNETFRNISNDH